METLGDLVPLLVLLGITAVLWHFSRKAQPVKNWEATPGSDYQVVLTQDLLSCTHPGRPPETVRWDDIVEIRLIWTEDNPPLPDEWFVFVGADKGCSIPTQAIGFEQLWADMENRFPGLDRGKMENALEQPGEAMVWKRQAV